MNKLTPLLVQRCYNELSHLTDPNRKSLQPKSVKDVHGVLHKLLEQAVKNGLLRNNPSNACVLPKLEHKEIKPLNIEETSLFCDAVAGHQHEFFYKIALFTGLRESELLGLSWESVDMEKGVIIVKQQLRKSQQKGGGYSITPTKNGKCRTIAIPPTVVELFERQRDRLKAMATDAGCIYG